MRDEPQGRQEASPKTTSRANERARPGGGIGLEAPVAFRLDPTTDAASLLRLRSFWDRGGRIADSLHAMARDVRIASRGEVMELERVVRRICAAPKPSVGAARGRESGGSERDAVNAARGRAQR
jgi:hypothetical protein